MSGKDRILDILGGEDMLRFMVDANRFCYPDDSSVNFLVGDKQVYIRELREQKDFLAPGFLLCSIRIVDRNSGDVLNEHSAMFTFLIKRLLEWDLNLSFSF